MRVHTHARIAAALRGRNHGTRIEATILGTVTLAAVYLVGGAHGIPAAPPRHRTSTRSRATRWPKSLSRTCRCCAESPSMIVLGHMGFIAASTGLELHPLPQRQRLHGGSLRPGYHRAEASGPRQDGHHDEHHQPEAPGGDLLDMPSASRFRATSANLQIQYSQILPFEPDDAPEQAPGQPLPAIRQVPHRHRRRGARQLAEQHAWPRAPTPATARKIRRGRSTLRAHGTWCTHHHHRNG